MFGLPSLGTISMVGSLALSSLRMSQCSLGKLKAVWVDETLNSILIGVLKRWVFKVAVDPWRVPGVVGMASLGRKGAMADGCGEVSDVVMVVVVCFLLRRSWQGAAWLNLLRLRCTVLTKSVLFNNMKNVC